MAPKEQREDILKTNRTMPRVKVIAVLSSRDTQNATYDNALIAEAAKVALNALK
ncbi:beta-lactamase [Neobacillus vireti LMG 21834]|uniref:Beta-lactamase n=1 Tax=Neobacillus vireti LMG 21834 TaxID=1131730 RepID=A0AB94IR82_9BACI|nr:beta-lactamase [Neobacillus vireti LMG 21834]